MESNCNFYHMLINTLDGKISFLIKHVQEVYGYLVKFLYSYMSKKVMGVVCVIKSPVFPSTYYL